MTVEYTFVESPKHDHTCIGIKSGRFAGVIYKYGKIIPKEENDKLRTISFDNVNDFHDSVGRLKKEKETMRVEMIALSKSLAEVYQELIDLRKERSNAESKPVSRNNNDIDLDRIVDDTFDKWVAQKPWHKRWLYKIGSVSWRDFAFIMLAFWTIPMIVLLTLKVEGVIN